MRYRVTGRPVRYQGRQYEREEEFEAAERDLKDMRMRQRLGDLVEVSARPPAPPPPTPAAPVQAAPTVVAEEESTKEQPAEGEYERRDMRARRRRTTVEE